MILTRKTKRTHTQPPNTQAQAHVHTLTQLCKMADLAKISGILDKNSFRFIIND